ncbi:MAG: cupin domain-containing protein, partial [Geminicoccaceae bacterium]|nr:cupin domain-containing protein [Geminicoccaceae bacterium]
MQINTDRAVRVRIETEGLPWASSPTPGVERRMLERDGGEVARATSLVRFARGSAFPEHEHGGGEEFLVLDGVFSDEEGDFPAGWYVRNPPGSRHSPRSASGCTILVKLRQMAADDRAKVRIDTTRAERSTVGRGVSEAVLFAGDGERVAMIVLEPGAAWRF